MAMTLYGSPLSFPTYKVALMLSMAGQPFEFKFVNLRQGEHKQPDHIARNRYGQVPALVDDGEALCQSNAILTYLADKLGKFSGPDAKAKQRDREWLAWEADQLLPGIARPRCGTTSGSYAPSSAISPGRSARSGTRCGSIAAATDRGRSPWRR